MRNTLILLLVVLVASAIYWPILRMARRDIAARAAAGMSNGVLYAVLLLPLIGPFVYLLLRRRFTVK